MYGPEHSKCNHMMTPGSKGLRHNFNKFQVKVPCGLCQHKWEL